MAHIPGIEGRHAWGHPGGAPLITLNDLSTFPRFKLVRILGLFGRADSDDFRDPAHGRMGEVPQRGRLRGKTITYEGKIEARTLADLGVARGLLADAFSEQPVAPNREMVMALTFHPGYASAPFFQYGAKCLQCEIPDEQTLGPTALPTPFSRLFTVVLRASDPRLYSPAALKTATFSGGTVTVINTGGAPTDPGIQLAGTGSGHIEVTRTSPSPTRKLVFDGLNLATEGPVSIAFDKRRISGVGGIDLRGKLDRVLSTWWDAGVDGLSPGSNSIVLSASVSPTFTGSYVAWRDAHYG